MPKTPYKNDGVILIQVPDRHLGCPEHFRREVRIQIPIFQPRLTADERAMLERGYAIAVSACLRALKNGLDDAAYAHVNPLQLIDAASTYRNPDWDGWDMLEKWAPRAQLAITFRSFFGRGYLSISKKYRLALARTFAGTAAGLAFALSSLAISNLEHDSYGQCVHSINRREVGLLSREEAVNTLRIVRRTRNRIHIHRRLLGGVEGPFAIAKVLIHEASHAYAQTRDHYYLKSSLLSDTSTPGKEILTDYSLSTPGRDLPAGERQAFSATGTMKRIYLLENADTIAFFIIHFGREGSRTMTRP